MTVAEMADLVCGKVRQTDASSVTRCKTYLRHRYKMICQDELWKDLLFRLEFTYAMSDTTPPTTAADLFGPNYFSRDAGIWHLPSVVDRALAVRSSSFQLPVTDPFQLIATTLDQFADTGEPVQFYAEGAVVADLRGALSGVEAEGVVLTAAAGDAGLVARVRYLDLDGEEQTLAQALVAGNSPVFYPQVILSASKPTTAAAVTFALDGETVASAAPTATTWKKFPRVRLVPIPTADAALKALVKLKPQEMTDDNDEPQVRGIENCLMAFAQADLLQHARQYGKAQLVVAEGTTLLAQLKTVAVAQEANLQRILPAVSDVPGEVWDGFGGKGIW